MVADTITMAAKALQTEVFAAAVYDYLAAKYPNEATRKAFAEAAEMEKGHIIFWSDILKKRGVDITRVRSSGSRLALYKLSLWMIGKGLTLRMMENSENQAIEMYSSMTEGSGLDNDEKQGLNKVLEDELVHEGVFTREESKFEDFITYMKDAVLGMSDGLVEILAVTTGLAGASGVPVVVAISGLVVGIAGALSMAASTYTSTRSQKQVHEGIINRIISASKFVGHIFKERVSNHLEKQGYSKRLSRDVAEESAQNHRLLSNFLAEREYGLREEHLGSPFKAALYAGLSNLLGGIIPLFPYFFLSNITTALILSLILATVALAVTGFFVSILAYLSPGKKIGEMIVTGLGSAAVTYGIGRAASVLLGMRT